MLPCIYSGMIFILVGINPFPGPNAARPEEAGSEPQAIASRTKAHFITLASAEAVQSTPMSTSPLARTRHLRYRKADLAQKHGP